VAKIKESRMQRLAAWLCTFLACGACAFAAGAETDKSQFTLFNPTPPQLMRELNTDRPDVTESPYTVDAGHFQIETSLLEYVYDDTNESTLNEYSLLPSNFKIGLLNNADLQFVFEPHIWQQARSAGHTDHNEGFGATQVRFKINFWGNDGGDTAFGIMPFVQFPTAASSIGGVDHVEGGLIVPLAIKLPHDWELDTMAEFDVLRDDADEHYGQSFVHTLSLSHPIVDKLDGFVEYVGSANRELGAGYIALAGGGVTYGIGENAQLDGAVYFGISDGADDFRALIGVSYRM
jgi:hypothetical protein